MYIRYSLNIHQILKFPDEPMWFQTQHRYICLYQLYNDLFLYDIIILTASLLKLKVNNENGKIERS
jgi:hypothetical protein